MNALPPEKEPERVEPRFAFDALFVDRVLFEHLPLQPAGEGETRPAKVNVAVHIGGRAVISQDVQRAEISLEALVTPDPRWQPYRIEVKVTGRFSRVAGTPEEFAQFCKLGVPPILFPYVRETVHRLTHDGRYGTVRLDPLNIQAMVADWKPLEATSPSG